MLTVDSDAIDANKLLVDILAAGSLLSLRALFGFFGVGRNCGGREGEGEKDNN